MVINIPGVTEEPIVVEPGSRAAPAAEALPEEPAAPGAGAPAALERRDRALAEIDGRIAAKEKELARKESEFREYRRDVEKNLLDIESRRSEILLGRIYKALREVARDEGVSVVVDKKQILFGQNSVDLTEKVIRRLESAP